MHDCNTLAHVPCMHSLHKKGSAHALLMYKTRTSHVQTLFRGCNKSNVLGETPLLLLSILSCSRRNSLSRAAFVSHPRCPLLKIYNKMFANNTPTARHGAASHTTVPENTGGIPAARGRACRRLRKGRGRERRGAHDGTVGTKGRGPGVLPEGDAGGKRSLPSTVSCAFVACVRARVNAAYVV